MGAVLGVQAQMVASVYIGLVSDVSSITGSMGKGVHLSYPWVLVPTQVLPIFHH